jgi:hypothetical protein
MVNTFYGANTNPYINYGDMATGITITGLARYLLEHAIDLCRKKYGDKSVIYSHTDSVYVNRDVDVDWVTKRLRLILEATIPNVESDWIRLDKDTYREGVWLAIGNYALRNEDGSVTKHGSNFKSKNRSDFYKMTLNKLIDARLDNTVNSKFIDELYDFDSLPMETFMQRRTLNRKLSDYKSTTDMLLTLAQQGVEVGIEPLPRTQYNYYKTKDGYRIQEMVESKTELDVRYYWDIVSGLLSKFGLDRDIKKNPPLTILDKSQKSIMEWI